MSARRAQLSKSRLLAARQCLKRLHLEVWQPERKVHSTATEAAFRTGNAIGDIAHAIYGSADAVLIPYTGGLAHALRKTARLLTVSPPVPIFEATLQYGGLLVRVDVLLPDGDAWRMVEVKAATSLKDEHLFDCAAQRFVLEGSGVRLSGVALAHVDKQFVYAGDGDYSGLLVEQDVSDATEKMTPAIAEWIVRANEAAGPTLPEIAVGAHCYAPYECPYVGHCWPQEADYPVQGLGGGRAKLGTWIAAGFRDLRDVPAAELTGKQQRIQAVTKSGQAQLLDGARHFVTALPYPRYYLDFETVMPAIPVWAGTCPYEMLAIQWSCHFEKAQGDVEHTEFLDLSGELPVRRLAESLIRVLGTTGPVLMYTSYEKTVINSLAVRFPDLETPLGAIRERLVDLHPVVQRNYYHPDMAGSWSIKSVLPTISNELNYSELAGIQEGTAASEGYLEAIDAQTSASRKAELREQLLRYCKLDTEAMLRLVHFLATAPKSAR